MRPFAWFGPFFNIVTFLKLNCAGYFGVLKATIVMLLLPVISKTGFTLRHCGPVSLRVLRLVFKNCVLFVYLVG